MPSAALFRQAGLFVLPGFLEPKLVADLCRLMEDAPTEKTTVAKAGGVVHLDEKIRKVQAALLPKDVRAVLKERMFSLTPELEQHFKVRLVGYETPQYLIYRPGNFFKLHSDSNYAGGNEAAERRVSVVIFLNRESQEPAEGTYGQGRLTFYGLLNGPEWERCGFALNPEPGLLIAFPSDKLHEVTPVSHGQRLTIATWFHAPDAEPKLDGGEPLDVKQTARDA